MLLKDRTALYQNHRVQSSLKVLLAAYEHWEFRDCFCCLFVFIGELRKKKKNAKEIEYVEKNLSVPPGKSIAFI